jgi:hypothetical protein
MFTVNWVVRGKEIEPIESGRFSTLIMACRYRMAMMRLKYPETPPDGFIVIDDSGKEIGRWFDTAALP